MASQKGVPLIVVPGYGPKPCDLMLVGEAPGKNEAFASPPRPFVGLSGQELRWYLSRHGLSIDQFYLDNVVQLYQPGNPDPTKELLDEWTPKLLATIAEVRPKVILLLGRFAVRFFLGDDADMDSCHGIPHQGGEFDASYKDRAMGAVIVPSYHPAFGLHQIDAKALIDMDIRRAAEVIRLVRGGRRDLVKFRRDEYSGLEDYHDVTGTDLAGLVYRYAVKGVGHRVGFDTEGTPEEPWSLQISWKPGEAYVLRVTQPDFAIGVAALQKLADSGCVFITHDAGTPRGTGYDTQVARSCGLELRDANHANTMYDAYSLRLEPKGLKPLLWRWCGMRQDDYLALIGDVGRQKQIEYLEKVAGKKDWPRVVPTVVRENDGTLKLKKFGKLESRAKMILSDIAKDKRNKDGDPVDPVKRWAMLEPELRKIAESEYGKLPMATLNDIELSRAVWYAARDADGTLRLDRALTEERLRMGVAGVYETGMQVLPIFEEMQHNGMPASKRAFVDLADTVSREMEQLQAELSANWFGGRPFNPAPNTKDVEALVQRLGITGLKRTKKSGKVSTSMRSLEYLAPKYPALSKIGNWRRRQKVLTTYCLPMLEMSEDGSDSDSDLFLVHGNIKPVTVETRRLAMEEPSLLNQPIRTEIGRKVRACYMTTTSDDPDDPNVEVFGGWDFSSQEVRVTAHVTQDPLLCAIMRDPTRKIHMETASRVFGKPIDQIDEVGEKIPAKTAFFGMVYGLREQGLLDLFRSFGLETWALDDCMSLIAEINRIYRGLPETIARVRAETLRTGMVRDLYGHIRYLPGIWSSRRVEVEEAARQAFSHLVQSTAQGITQNAMAAMREPIRKLRSAGVKWTLQIHDEIVFRFARWLYSVMDQIVVDCMTNKYGGPSKLKLCVPVLVDGHMATRWDKLK